MQWARVAAEVASLDPSCLLFVCSSASVSLLAAKRKPGACGTLAFDPLDLGAELAQLFVQMFVAAIDVINTADFGHAVGF